MTGLTKRERLFCRVIFLCLSFSLVALCLSARGAPEHMLSRRELARCDVYLFNQQNYAHREGPYAIFAPPLFWPVTQQQDRARLIDACAEAVKFRPYVSAYELALGGRNAFAFSYSADARAGQDFDGELAQIVFVRGGEGAAGEIYCSVYLHAPTLQQSAHYPHCDAPIVSIASNDPSRGGFWHCTLSADTFADLAAFAASYRNEDAGLVLLES